jgi:hypothetical protein
MMEMYELVGGMPTTTSIMIPRLSVLTCYITASKVLFGSRCKTRSSIGLLGLELGEMKISVDFLATKTSILSDRQHKCIDK